MEQTIWHGTQQESTDLLAAIDHHCACYADPDGKYRTTCPPHTLILDQRTVDHLIFARRMRHAWVLAELKESVNTSVARLTALDDQLKADDAPVVTPPTP